ncbi:MAG: class I SAM-dependent methyltransferase [Vicinamibacterales bacterium]
MKSASPTDAAALRAARHERIAALGYDYAAQPKRAVDACNLCGGSVFTVLTYRDRYGYPATAVACRSCGLTTLSPVMTPDAYKQFYVGVYRPLVSAFHGRLIDARTIQDEQREYAAERGAFVAPFVDGRGFRTLLDIGGSTGVVAHAFAGRFGLRGTVIDPSPLEIDEARALGLETVTGLVEDYDPAGRAFDVVIMCQTVDHLLDIAGALRAIRSLIRPDGVFFIDIVDFRAAYLRNWSVEDAIKIDHPYYLTAPVMEAYLARAGFDILRVDYAADHLHVGYVCRPGTPAPETTPGAITVARFHDELRFVQNAPGPAGGR